MHASNTRAGSLYTTAGQRKYLTAAERSRFVTAALSCRRAELRALCLTLVYTGCRISEALAITPKAIERQAGFIAIRSLKKRKRIVMIREVPVPADLFQALEEVHDFEERDMLLWPVSRPGLAARQGHHARSRPSGGAAYDSEGLAAQLRDSRDPIRGAAQPRAAPARSRQHDHHGDLSGCPRRGRTRDRRAWTAPVSAAS
jgi:hypothetical protein